VDRRRRRILFLAGSVGASVALVLVACSDDGLIPIPLADITLLDGAKPDGKSKLADGALAGDDDDGGITADCSAAPALHSASFGFFCPFLPKDAGPDGSTTSCGDDQTCCNPGKDSNGKFPPSFCAATPRAAKGADDQSACAAQAATFGSQWVGVGSSWECADRSNCSDGQVCCMYTETDLAPPDQVNIGPDQNKAIPTACNAKQAFKYGGTHCASSCAGSEIQMCSTNDDNCTPKICRAFEINPGGRDLGYCN
jgi:hypothetical protein